MLTFILLEAFGLAAVLVYAWLIGAFESVKEVRVGRRLDGVQ